MYIAVGLGAQYQPNPGMSCARVRVFLCVVHFHLLFSYLFFLFRFFKFFLKDVMEIVFYVAIEMLAAADYTL